MATRQEADSTEVVNRPPDVGTPADRQLLRQRGREVLHPGDPLEIEGLEEGENDFRARTPALSRSDHEPTLVDVDENHRRRLAMYSDGERFSHPLPLAMTSAAVPRGGGAVGDSGPLDPGTTSEEGGVGAWVWGLLLAIVGGGAALLARRRSWN